MGQRQESVMGTETDGMLEKSPEGLCVFYTQAAYMFSGGTRSGRMIYMV